MITYISDFFQGYFIGSLFGYVTGILIGYRLKELRGIDKELDRLERAIDTQELRIMDEIKDTMRQDRKLYNEKEVDALYQAYKYFNREK